MKRILSVPAPVVIAVSLMVFLASQSNAQTCCQPCPCATSYQCSPILTLKQCPPPMFGPPSQPYYTQRILSVHPTNVWIAPRPVCPSNFQIPVMQPMVCWGNAVAMPQGSQLPALPEIEQTFTAGEKDPPSAELCDGYCEDLYGRHTREFETCMDECLSGKITPRSNNTIDEDMTPVPDN